MHDMTITLTRRILPIENSGKLRAILSLDSVKINGEEVPDYQRRLFMYIKPTSKTESIPLKQCNYLTVVPVNVFNRIFKPKFGDANPETWENLPVSSLILNALEEVSDATAPSDLELGPFATDRILVSSVAIIEDFPPVVDTFYKQIVGQLTNLKTNYIDYAQVATVIDTDKYPVGWREDLV